MSSFIILNICPKFYLRPGGSGKHTIVKFAGDTKLVGTIDLHEGRTAIQRDFKSLEEWSDSKFNTDKCKVLKWEGKAPLEVQGGD